MIPSVDDEKKPIVKNLQDLAKESQVLVLWLDCDREGEAIAYEVIDICCKVNPRLEIFRAHFSTVTKEDMVRAYNNLRKPDPRLRDAVLMRQEVDLRLGAAFTRFQTLRMRQLTNSINKKIISYGPCQFPTLGFVVERFLKKERFIPEKFWFITILVSHQGKRAEFKWSRVHLHDEIITATIYESLYQNPACFISKVERKETSKRRPAPLNTIDFQKLACTKLKMPSAKIMEISEKLYQMGLISYPRTETNSYNETIDLEQLVKTQGGSHLYTNYVHKLMYSGGFLKPRNGGKDDKAHPPIHPVKVPTEQLPTEHARVLDLITRHFLATCSHDAKGYETLVELTILDEKFHTSGLAVGQYNWLEIFPYERWAEATTPDFVVGQKFAQPDELLLKNSQTTAPNLLSEKELISLMDKNGIGTDATVHEHIKTIQDREYAESLGGFFRPLPLGLALVEGYNLLGYDLAKPVLRAEMERDMNLVARGQMERAVAVSRSIVKMKEIYFSIVSRQNELFSNILNIFTDRGGSTEDNSIKEAAGPGTDAGTCGLCNQTMKLYMIPTESRLSCESCNKSFRLPKFNQINPLQYNCPLCNFQIYEITSATDTKYKICPQCYVSPPPMPEDSSNNIEDAAQEAKPQTSFATMTMPCFKCPNRLCKFAKGFGIFQCKTCEGGYRVNQGKSRIFLGCSNFPTCNSTIFLPKQIVKAEISDTECPMCQSLGRFSFLCNLKFDDSGPLPIEITMIISEESEPLFCLAGCDEGLKQLDYTAEPAPPREQMAPAPKPYGQYGATNCQPGPPLFGNPNPPGSKAKSTWANYLMKQQVVEKRSITINVINNSPSNSFGTGTNYPSLPPQDNYRGRPDYDQNPSVTCYSCKEPGHYSSSCPRKVGNQGALMPSTSSASQFYSGSAGASNMIGTCYYCQEAGHYASTCPQRQAPGTQTPSPYGYAYANQEPAASQPKGRECHICKETSHYSINCPNRGKKIKKEEEKPKQVYLANETKIPRSKREMAPPPPPPKKQMSEPIKRVKRNANPFDAYYDA